MPELLVDFITSLDGYGAAEGWPGWWGLQGPEYLAWLGEQPEADHTVLLGATTYRLMSGLAAEGEPGTDELAGLPKLVFSRTLTAPLAWPNTQLVAQDAVAFVRERKARPGAAPCARWGASPCAAPSCSAGLVDRFRVVVFPVITGSSGRDRIYDGYPDVALELVASRTFDGRIQLLEYVPTVLAGPPGTDHGRRLATPAPSARSRACCGRIEPASAGRVPLPGSRPSSPRCATSPLTAPTAARLARGTRGCGPAQRGRRSRRCRSGPAGR